MLIAFKRWQVVYYSSECTKVYTLGRLPGILAVVFDLAALVKDKPGDSTDDEKSDPHQSSTGTITASGRDEMASTLP